MISDTAPQGHPDDWRREPPRPAVERENAHLRSLLREALTRLHWAGRDHAHFVTLIERRLAAYPMEVPS